MQDLFLAARFEMLSTVTPTEAQVAAAAAAAKEGSFCVGRNRRSEVFREPSLYPATDAGVTWPSPSPAYSSTSVSSSSFFSGEGTGLMPPKLTKKGKPRKIKLWEMEGPAAERARKGRENRERKKMEKAFLLEKHESLMRRNQDAEREMSALSGEITASEERQSVLHSALRTEKEEIQRLRSHMGNCLMELEKVSRGMDPSYTQEVTRNLCHDMHLNFISHSGITGQIPTCGCITYRQEEEDSPDLFFE
ncbi:uncharacterized protein LOC143024291 [Oratosquilla oratoria]|uniref:uncharacterized protein LOC143024291 n=1 Tax=Oratosquilla oratoria TaxID=337810 RepID=UPI003F76867B